MSYAGTLSAHDADAHIMETPELLRSFADPAIRELMTDQTFAGLVGGEVVPARSPSCAQRMLIRRTANVTRAELMSRKNWAATGSFIKEDRPKALDLLGFKSQLMFNTFWSGYLLELERTGDIGLLYGAARAHTTRCWTFVAWISGCCRRVMCRWWICCRRSCRTGNSRWRQGTAYSFCVPATTLTESCLLVRGLATSRRIRSPNCHARGWWWRVITIPAVSRTVCRPSRIFMVVRRTSDPSTTWPSRCHRAGYAVDRWRIGTIPNAQNWHHRTRRCLDTQFHAST